MEFELFPDGATFLPQSLWGPYRPTPDFFGNPQKFQKPWELQPHFPSSQCIIYWYSCGVTKMARNTSITLSEHFEAFVEEQVAAGRYGNASEVIRAGLRLLEERDAKLEALRRAIIEGLESGPAEPFDIEAFLAKKAREPKRA